MNLNRYVGVPFEDGGRTLEGLDCWGLVRLIYAQELGIILPSYGEISARQLTMVARKITEGADEEIWFEPDVPNQFDMVLLRLPKTSRIGHVGVLVDTGRLRLLHIEKSTDSVIVPLNHWTVRSRIAGYRRMKM